MILRKATYEDLEQIVELANAVKLNYDNPQKDGFIVYVLDSEQYQLRIENSGLFYVAEQDKEIIGYLMCYSNEEFDKLYSLGELDHEDQLTETIFNKPGKFVFGDHIAVKLGSNYHGVGKSLMNRLFFDLQKENISLMYVGVLEKPVKNITSKRFVTSLGFQKEVSITNKDKTQWGIYYVRI